MLDPMLKRRVAISAAAAAAGIAALAALVLAAFWAGLGPYGRFLEVVSQPGNYASEGAFLRALDGGLAGDAASLLRFTALVLVPCAAALAVLASCGLAVRSGVAPGRWNAAAALGLLIAVPALGTAHALGSLAGTVLVAAVVLRRLEGTEPPGSGNRQE